MKIVKEYILREIAGEYILVPTGENTQEFNGMITISETAKFIWENLEKADSLEELVSLVREEYEVDEKTAFEDTAQMIHELLQYGFIECTKENKSW